MLVWTQCPSEGQCQLLKCGAQNFFCSRKHKFGINLQAVCDSNLKFLEVWMTHPGSASDYLSFTTSSFYQNLKAPGFLAQGIVIFGDNAYVSNEFMVTPYKGASGGVLDDFNFFHSQLRINIECAFGLLVQRWGILRTPLSATMSVKCWTALIIALCKLHNLFIDLKLQRQRANIQQEPTEEQQNEEDDLGTSQSYDEFMLQSNGAVCNDAQGRPNHLLDGGHHFEDVTVDGGEDFSPGNQYMPRAKLKQQVELSGLHRPNLNRST